MTKQKYITQKCTPGPWEAVGGTMPDGSPLLLNDGSRPILAGQGDDRKRIAVVDMQTSAKRGQAYNTHCPERDANARLIALAPEMAEVLKTILNINSLRRHPLGAPNEGIAGDIAAATANARAILAKIAGE